MALWIGLELTLYGMGLVFLLLALLWGVIALVTSLDRTPAPGKAAGEPAGPAAASARVRAADGGALEPELLAAVVIACRAHRMSRRKQAAPEMRTHKPGSLPSRWVSTGRTRQNRSWAPGGRFS
jgi:Na+-transporting methylmalonyl-CoA/oxaloacetate decarboxylase gamma subunit